MAKLWKDAPENPNRGGEPKTRKPKEPKAAKEPKEPKPKASRKKKAASSDEEEEEEEEAIKPSTDAMEGEDEPEAGYESDDWYLSSLFSP
ncbi:hypothetical protein C0991_004591 [Blastosporella zonata]|nr:hypothetical protein C0991_004591 [Blastosporella zonata]